MDKKILIGGAILLIIIASQKKKVVKNNSYLTLTGETFGGGTELPDRGTDTGGGVLGYYVDNEG
jgi:hypothetical protein